MGVSISFLHENWLNLAQTISLLGGGLLAMVVFLRENRGRKLGHFLTLAQQHRELWSEAHRRPELARIFQSEVDLIANPISPVEEEFLYLVIVHFQTGWLLANDAAFLDKRNMAADAKAFFSLPLPRTVWNATRADRDPKFVRFIERALEPKPHHPSNI